MSDLMVSMLALAAQAAAGETVPTEIRAPQPPTVAAAALGGASSAATAAGDDDNDDVTGDPPAPPSTPVARPANAPSAAVGAAGTAAAATPLDPKSLAHYTPSLGPKVEPAPGGVVAASGPTGIVAAPMASASAGPSAGAAETAVAQDEARPGNHRLEVYGFIQMDAIQDFDRVDPDWDATLRPSRIPTTEGQFGSDGQHVISVRQSRLGVRGGGELADRPYEFRLEADLFGTGVDAGQTTVRLRHAYASWGPILAGQTHTLFMDIDQFPNVIDYWGPAGMVFVRNPQIRLTFLNSNGITAAVALEQPNDDIDPGGIRLIDPELATNLRSNEELPDLTAMFRYGGDWGHVQLSGLMRKIGFDTLGTPDNEPSGSEFGWGIMGGGVFTLGLATFRLGAVYGEGIASYMNDGGMDLAPSAALVPNPPGPTPPIFPPPPPNLILSAEAVPLLGITAYVDLAWTSKLSSAVGYSLTEVDNTNFQEATAFHRGEYASANLLWAPDPRILTGLELLWGKRTDNDGDSGEDMRMQFSFKLSFSSNDIWGN